MRSCIRRLSSASGIAILALGAGISRAGAADDPDFTVDFPAGVACAGFDLRAEGRGGNQHTKELRDEEGNLVRMITAGTMSALTFINLSTGATLTFRSTGSVQHTTFDSDGTQTITSTGHTVLVMFPTDVPAGPSTTLVKGKLVTDVDSSGVTTLHLVRGTSTDICAALSG